jgi:hypothetical protein
MKENIIEIPTEVYRTKGVGKEILIKMEKR